VVRGADRRLPALLIDVIALLIDVIALLIDVIEGANGLADRGVGIPGLEFLGVRSNSARNRV
jgi:hypothetical protein